DGPTSAPHAMTFTVTAEGAVGEPGDHLAADAVVRLTYDDALALSRGTLESGVALREGRLKVSGDVQALVPLLEWLLESHSA
ncbi:MAG TPA: SCP2 sterol-binding domain-containing protein, partial [Acidimicrobiales bacterium]|nr:SCP2 sterol-binding domain-containing protein [Acidimicrobiales bacterium]